MCGFQKESRGIEGILGKYHLSALADVSNGYHRSCVQHECWKI